MNDAYLEKAKKLVANPKILCVLASKRAAQIARGARKMVKCAPDESPLDIALLEIAEGKLSYEFGGVGGDEVDGEHTNAEAEAIAKAASILG